MSEQYKCIMPVKYAGGYLITGKSEHEKIKYMFTDKPSFINRFFCKILLGWHWEDD